MTERKAKPRTRKPATAKPAVVEVTNLGGDGMLEKVNVSACGHINRHYRSDDVMACVLPAGHNGDHEADYPGGRAHWKDAAGRA